MDYNTITERYTYDEGELYYRENLSPRARRGQKVGSMSGCGYKQIKYNGKQYKYHRVIYCYFNECDYLDIDGWDVDHLDNDKSNNRIENLILCEHCENQMNRVDTKRNGGFSKHYEYLREYNRTVRRERRRNAKNIIIAKTNKDITNDNEGD